MNSWHYTHWGVSLSPSPFKASALHFKFGQLLHNVLVSVLKHCFFCAELILKIGMVLR